MEHFTNMCAILSQGHANLLCNVPVLIYVLPERAQDTLRGHLKSLPF